MSNLNVHVEDVSPVLKRVRVDVPAERVSAVTERVFRQLGKTVRLRGYRPGKVPRRVLEKHFADQVRSDVARELVSDTFEEALNSTTLTPVAAPTVEPAEVKDGEAFTYSARVEVRPEISLKQYKDFEITLPKTREITDKDIDERLESMREQASTLVPVEDRDVLEMGDVAVLDFSVKFEGDEGEPTTREGASIRVDAGKFLEGHGEKLAGLKVGEERSFEETVEGEEAPEELRGKTASITAKLTGIKRRELPALDDEFARDVAEVDSLEELRTKIRSEMEEAVTSEADEIRRNALLDKLIEANEIEVPPALVERMLEENIRRLTSAFAPQGFQLPPEALENLREAGKEKAERDVRAMLLLDAVADAESIEVSDEEYNAKLEERAAEMGVPVERIKSFYDQGEHLREGLIGTIRTDKALAILESTAQITTETE